MRGRNWIWRVDSEGTVLLRNVGSVDPKFDGWWLDVRNARPLRITPSEALVWLKNAHHTLTPEERRV